MHGRDWKALGDQLRAFIPDLSSRSDLNWLLSQMVGDLNVSHTYIGGGDQGPARSPEVRTSMGLLGVDLESDSSGFVRFAKIFGPTTYNADLVAPLARPDVDVKPGDYLVAIDGHELKAGENPYRYPPGGAGPEGASHRERQADGRRCANLRDRAAAVGRHAALQPLAGRQHRRDAQGIERRDRLQCTSPR